MSIQPRSPGVLSSVFLIIFFLSLIVSHFFSPLAQSTQSSLLQPLTKRLLRAVLSSTAPGQGVAGDSRCLSAERPHCFLLRIFKQFKLQGLGILSGVPRNTQSVFARRQLFITPSHGEISVLKESTHKTLTAAKPRYHSLA